MGSAQVALVSVRVVHSCAHIHSSVACGPEHDCLQAEQVLCHPRLHGAAPSPPRRLLIAAGVPGGAGLELRMPQVLFGFKAVLYEEHMHVKQECWCHPLLQIAEPSLEDREPV